MSQISLIENLPSVLTSCNGRGAILSYLRTGRPALFMYLYFEDNLSHFFFLLPLSKALGFLHISDGVQSVYTEQSTSRPKRQWKAQPGWRPQTLKQAESFKGP